MEFVKECKTGEDDRKEFQKSGTFVEIDSSFQLENFSVPFSPLTLLDEGKRSKYCGLSGLAWSIFPTQEIPTKGSMMSDIFIMKSLLQKLTPDA